MIWDFASTFATLAEAEPVAATAPDVPLYGSDLQCTDDLTEDMTERDGADPLLVAEHFYRMLRTPRGTLVDAPASGIDLRSSLSKGLTQQGLALLRDQIAAQAEDDDRIDSVNVQIVPSDDGSELEITVGGVLSDSAQTFTLIMGLTDSDLLLREMLS
jgi:hypothetical protein